MTDDLVFLNALNRISFLGAVRIGALLRCFGSARAVWEAAPDRFGAVPGLQNYAARFAEERRRIDPDREWRRLQDLAISCYTPQCASYPPLLKEIAHPPPLLYCRGAVSEQDALAIAIVGSRRCTYYGRQAAQKLARELAGLGLTVVSGMALGIDTAAHQGALAARGRTVAVLGCAVDYCYPPGNNSLMRQIMDGGAVLSEFPLDTLPLPQHFPQRNRIISGLSLGTVVVEATLKSGALITARYALEQNREVFAVPGNINSPYSRGAHDLLKEGARLVETAADILEELAVGPVTAAAAAAKERTVSLNDQERLLLEVIPYQPLHSDEIIRISGVSADRVSTILLHLELKGLVRQLPGKYFCRP
ncbi:MAG: DNA-processing protein DprA [Bacillota bacterium]